MLEIQRWRGQSTDALLEEGLSEREILEIMNREGRTFRPAYVNGVRREREDAQGMLKADDRFRERFHR